MVSDKQTHNGKEESLREVTLSRVRERWWELWVKRVFFEIIGVLIRKSVLFSKERMCSQKKSGLSRIKVALLYKLPKR